MSPEKVKRKKNYKGKNFLLAGNFFGLPKKLREKNYIGKNFLSAGNFFGLPKKLREKNSRGRYRCKGCFGGNTLSSHPLQKSVPDFVREWEESGNLAERRPLSCFPLSSRNI